MRQYMKTFAAAGVVSLLALPGFAAGHLDIGSMTCEEYNNLGGVDRDMVAVSVITSMNDNVQPTDGTATATASSVGTAAEESNSAVSAGSATATSIADAGDDMSRFAEEIKILNLTCSRNWDAKVTEAAAGSEGTR